MMFDKLQSTFWVITYLLLIVYSIRNKKHAIPLVAVVLNYSWECVAFSKSINNNFLDVAFFKHLSWFLLDTIIILLYLFYETKINVNLKRKLMFVLSWIFLTCLNVYLFKNGYMIISCFIIDLIMEILFLIFIYKEKCGYQLSFLLIGIAKLLGDLFAWIEYKSNNIVYEIGLIVLFLNIFYIILILFNRKGFDSMKKNYIYRNKNKKIKNIIIIFSLCLFIIVGSLATLGVIYNKNQNKINKIIVSSTPYDIEYYVGEELNTAGLSIQVIRNNGKFYFVDASKCNISGFDSSKTEEKQIITVSYKGFICTFSVSIIELPKPIPVLKSIYIETLPKTEYKVGESLDTTGGVLVREYQDGSKKTINLLNKYVYGFSTENPGTYTLTVMYYENGIMAQTTYEIVVSE